MADRVRTINTAGGGDYTSIQTAFSMEPNFAAGEDNIVFNCYGGVDIGRISIAGGFTTSSAHRLKVYAKDKSGGVRGVGYRIDGAWGAYTGAVRTTVQWLECYDLPFRNSTADGYGALIVQNCTMDRCMAYDCGRHGISCSGAGFFYIMNCIVESCKRGISNGTGLLATDQTYIYNCTSINSTDTTGNGNGIILNTNSKAIVYNCYCGGNVGFDILVNGGGILTKLTTYTEDGSEGTPTLAFSTSAGVYFTNVTVGSDNCKLNSPSSGLVGVGTDLRTDPVFPITVDFNSETRPALPAVGAFEYIGGASKFMYYYTILMQGE